jgi:hypothetical protein
MSRLTWTNPGPSTFASDAVTARDVAHREDGRVEITEQAAFAVVERADADERHAARVDGGDREAGALERWAAQPHRCGQHHPVNVPGGARLGSVQIAVGVDPQHTAGLRAVDETAERAERDRMVAAEDERHPPFVPRSSDLFGDPFAGTQDLAEVARPSVTDRRGLRDRGLHVPQIGAVAPQLTDPRLQLRIADRRGAHVHTPPAGTEIERRADDRDR